MTREEAIKILMDGELNPCVAEDREACDMAIKALEQEPCEDVISRLEVLDKINQMGVKAFKTYNDYSELFDFVDTMSSVTPK